MAGIGGIVDLHDRPIDPSLVDRMIAAATNPGDGQIVRDGKSGLQAYSIPIAVEQPSLTWSEDGAIVVVADARLDSTPAVQSFGQALIADYQRHGSLTLASLDGDCAILLADIEKSLVLAARDPMSLRPLVFHYEDGLLLFASEPTHILATGLVPRRINEHAIAGHLAGGVLDLSWTFFAGIDQVKPGHIVTINRTGVMSKPYWSLTAAEGPPPDEQEAAAELARLLQKSVEERLPVQRAGVMLSGGLDSASLAAAAATVRDRHGLPAGIQAWSFAYTDTPEADERAVSAPLASALRIPVVDVDAELAPPLSRFPEGPDENDPLYGHYEPLLVHTIGLAATAGVESMMLGNRGDLVVGSDIYDFWALLREGGWSGLSNELMFMGRQTAREALWLDFVRPGIVDRLPLPIRRIATATRPRVWEGWMNPAFTEATGMAHLMIDHLPASPQTGPVGRRYRSILSPFQMRVATWMQRMHTRLGVRFVDPWADVDLISFILGLPPGLVQTPGDPKHISRLALETMAPGELAAPLSKTIPLPYVDQHLRGMASEQVLELMSGMESQARGYVGESGLRSHFAAFCSGAPLDGNFWAALSLEMWLRNFW